MQRIRKFGHASNDRFNNKVRVVIIMRVAGFFDNEERKQILELAETKLRATEWVGSGSMLLIKTENKNEYEVHTMRGYVTLSKKEVKELEKKRKKEKRKK